MTREGSQVGLFEITEATDVADQREMTLGERSGRKMSLIGEFGGRFKGGAGNPSIIWATDIVSAIKRKSGKAIFQDSSVPRHLIIYPNSNASILLFDADDEREAISYLDAEITKEKPALSNMSNGCLVHVIGKHLLCFDALGEMSLTMLRLNA